MRTFSDFFQNKKVLVTGHTGFKGSWLCHILSRFGASVVGYSRSVPTDPSLFLLSNVGSRITSITGDIRDYDKLWSVFKTFRPDIVIHMAAQPIVRESYVNPRYTYETNVMGTVNILECVRLTGCTKSFLNVTTDKVYENKEWVWGYRENESLNGFDPYSNSKSCSEIITHSYKNSFFSEIEKKVPISTARAGNVIGGGDFSPDRIIPDCIRAMVRKESIKVRNPNSIRPYQHVLEPLFAYLMIVKKQYIDDQYSGYYNVGPDDIDCVTTGQLVNLFCRYWGEEARWENKSDANGPHEATFLKLDCTKLKTVFGWAPRWHIDQAIQKTCEFSKAWLQGQDLSIVMDRQIEEYLGNV